MPQAGSPWILLQSSCLSMMLNRCQLSIHHQRHINIPSFYNHPSTIFVKSFLEGQKFSYWTFIAIIDLFLNFGPTNWPYFTFFSMNPTTTITSPLHDISRVTKNKRPKQMRTTRVTMCYRVKKEKPGLRTCHTSNGPTQ